MTKDDCGGAGETLALSALSHCMICPRRCGVDRLAGERGYCGAGRLARVALASLHPWEEPCISGERGAGTVFFSCCSLRCVFCQNAEISGAGGGLDVTEERLAEIFMERQACGAETLDLVTPTHYAPQILAALRRARANGLSLPVVWNSGGYEMTETIRAVAKDVDVFLPDLKYIDEESADRYSGARDYFAFAAPALDAMVEAVGAPVLDGRGILRRGVLVRHLVLPGHRRESMRLLDWLWARYGEGVLLSLMRQYTPLGRAAEYPEINRTLTTFEYESVTAHALDLGIRRCYVQEKAAADPAFVPRFDGSGVLARD